MNGLNKKKCQFYRSTPYGELKTKKEKCGVGFVYLKEGSDKTQAKINDNTPHLNKRYMICKNHALPHISKQEMSAVRCPFAFENCQIFLEGRSENTFYYNMSVDISTRQK